MRSPRQRRDFNLTATEGIIAVKHASNAGFAEAVCKDIPTATLRAMARQLHVQDATGDKTVLIRKVIDAAHSEMRSANA